MAVFSLLVAATHACAAQTARSRFEFVQPHMGTQFRIVLYATDAVAAARAAEAAFHRIRALDDTMSDYKSSSELTLLCARAGGPAVRVSNDLFRVLEKSQELARRTDGVFDITVGPVVRLWRRARRREELPDQEELARAERLVGYRYLQLDALKHTARLVKRGMMLDLGGIAKGFAADAALALLKQQGIDSALVAGGGDIAVGAPPPGKGGWRIGIAPPESPSNPPRQFLLLHDAGVSTSGDAEQFVVIQGRRYSHIIDPRTGMPLEGRYSVTIVAPNATTSDAAATAVCVLGPDRGLEFVKSTQGIGMLFVQETEHGGRTVQWGLQLTPDAHDAVSGQ